MISKVFFFSAGVLAILSSHLFCQQTVFPYAENFDTVAAPKLPVGWTTTTAKSPSGDFATTTSTPFSAPNAVLSTDSRVSQSLISPAVNFAGKSVGTLAFYERRTSTHNSGLLIEASLNNDTTFAIQIGDTLKNSGSTNYVLRSLPLPSSLNYQPVVRFRWRVVGNGSGATGTLRIDDVTITIKKAVDLGVTEMQFQPANVRSGENLAVHVGVANRAIGGTYSFTLQLFDDKNFDSLATTNEKVDEQTLTRSFAAAESTSFTLNYPDVSAGSHRLITKLTLDGDEDTTNNLFSRTMFVGYQARSILINEIMYAPTAGPEWVECTNNSSDTISLSQWKIGDNTSSRAVVTSQPIRIAPRQFFLIAKDSSILNYFPSISVPVIKASLPILNNDFDAVVIADPTGFAIDSVAYSSSWGGANGKSLERIDTALTSNQPSNWGSSRHPLGATPGAVNSLTKKEFDLSVERIFLLPAFPVASRPFELSAVIKNTGRQPQLNVAAQFFLDVNNDSIPQVSELVAEKILSTLLPADSQTVAHSISVALQSEQRVFVVVNAQHDDDTLNNIKSFSFAVGVLPQSIIVNEIMYAPAGDMPEWIEFYNASNGAVDIGGWKISDANTKSRASLAGPQSIIQPGAYFLVAADSSLQDYFSLSAPMFVASFSALNNATPDAVVLFDSRGLTMDSVWYKPSWGGTNGKSLERIDCFASSADSSNWKNFSPTPGSENGVAKKDFDVSLSSVSTTLMNESIRVKATVRNVGRNAASGFTVHFYYDSNADSIASAGELLHSVNAPSLAPNDSTTVQFDWQTNARGKIPLIVSAGFPADQRTSNNTIFISASNRFQPQSVVINEILYEPLQNCSEFIELVNRSADTLDLQGWKIMDASSSSGNRTVIQISNVPLPLLPNTFIVVAGDSSLLSQFPFLLTLSNGKVIIANKDLSLNNSGDDIILSDQTNTQIDSVRYSPSWHNPALNTSTAGKSLERINPSITSNDRRNWSSSVSQNGATPAQRNSMFTSTLPATASLGLTPNPFSPDNDGFEDFLAITYSLPSATSMIRVRCFDVQGRLIRTIANNEPAASSGTILWNGLDDNNQRVRIGMYIILFEALDTFGGVVRTMKDVAVVATKL